MEVHSLTRRQLEDYRSHLQAEEKSTATQEAYMRTALAFFADSAGAVTKASAAVYKRRLLAGGYAVRTVNARLAALNGLFGFLGWHECRLKTVRTQRDVFRTEKRELGQAEYARLCRAAERRRNRRLCLLLQTICGTGIRVGELAFVTVEAVRAGEAGRLLQGKGAAGAAGPRAAGKAPAVRRRHRRCRRTGVPHTDGTSPAPNKHLAGDEGALRGSGRRAAEGVPA